MNRSWRPALVLGAIASAAWLTAAPQARGQGAPGWAPRIISTADIGPVPGLDGGSWVHTDPPYRADGGRERLSGQIKKTLEFLLGFDPLEPATPTDAGQAAGVYVDAGPSDAS
ncbi:MAG: hypothetical protein HY904_11780 [Deltaproteobacteria bacterium]|nr:hypothetical protein [Deltaproteobacteria bacterium]